MPASTPPTHSTGSARTKSPLRVGAFEYLLGGILLTAAGFVIDLITGSLPTFTVAFAVLAGVVGAVRIFAGYRRGTQSDEP